ncbi:hypothetical protein [Haloarcula amylovorans]|uniref:hypothetical protein n=1 Tax=Haloarcula amylovorans TaxID=2562280 RepID=UPI0010761D39|nr:hypothetical protein [Halomicroarcula amylolytica]
MTTDQIELTADGTTATLTKVTTPTGARIEVESKDVTTRLDALDCETLTWQDESFYATLVDGEYEYRTVEPQPREPAAIQISNEYTVVRFRVEADRSAVELTAPKLGYGTRVDARAFAALTEKPKTFFSELLRTPFGPDDHE